MAGIGELFLFAEEADDYEDDDGALDHPETLGDPVPSLPSSSSSSSSGSAGPSDTGDRFIPAFSSGPSLGRSAVIFSDGGSDTGSDYLECPAGLALDVIDRRPPQRPRECIDNLTEALVSDEFRDLDDGVEDMVSDYLGLRLDLELEQELGFWSGFERQEDGGGGGGGSRQDGSNWGDEDDLILGLMSSGEPPSARPADGEGLRISESDSEDEQIAGMGDNSESGGMPDMIIHHWDCLHIEEDQSDADVEFEWEEVNGHDELMVGVAEDGSDGRGELDLDDEDEEWGRIFLGADAVAESYTGDDHVDFVNTSEYEILFGQFVDQASFIRGSPPAAKSVVETLPSIVLTEEDVTKDNTRCAVCKDEISLEERAKQLPCLHHYHGDCIFPWLAIRNTCPVCRYELPTDDPEYENSGAQQAGGSVPMEDSPVRYDFAMFHEV